MTILAAVKGVDGVHIACDRLSTRMGYLQLTVASKWIRVNSRWMVGIAGNARLRTLVAEQAGVHGRWNDANLSAFRLAEGIRQLVIDDKWKPRDSEGDPSDYGYEALMTDGNSIFLTIGAGVLTDMTHDKHAAAGIGEEIARGVYLALAGADPHGDSAKWLVERMVSIPQHIHRDCGGGTWTGFVPKSKSV